MPKKKQTKKEISQSLLDWCDTQDMDGKELSIRWDGGDDSGWANFQIDGEDVDNEHANLLTDKMYDILDYGSWAGDFTASGYATYNIEEKAFVGTDYFSQRESKHYEANIPVKIPKSIWFDSIRIAIESQEESISVMVDINIRNGFSTEKHDKVRVELENFLTESVQACVDNYIENHEDNDTFESVWDTFDILRTDLEEDGDYLKFNIETLDIRYNNTIEKEIYLSVKELQDEINEAEENVLS